MDNTYKIMLETDDPDLFVAAARAMRDNKDKTMKMTVNLAPMSRVIEEPVEVHARVVEVLVPISNGSWDVLRTSQQAKAAGV